MAVDYSAQIAALTAAIASGARTVSVEGKSVTYGSLQDMIQARAFLIRQQAKANGKPPAVGSVSGFGRGYRLRGSGTGWFGGEC